MAAKAQPRPREIKRLEKELQDTQAQAENSPVTAECVNGDLRHWQGQVLGPEDTPYEGGCFTIDIQIPPDYPYNPPKMKFDTKIWHPNISSQTGAICLDVLGKEWSPALTIRTALLSIQALLSAPEPSDPQDAQVAEMYTTDRPTFVQTARFWTETYAMASPQAEEENLTSLMDMGFARDAAEQALRDANGDVPAACELLMSRAGD